MDRDAGRRGSAATGFAPLTRLRRELPLGGAIGSVIPPTRGRWRASRDGGGLLRGRGAPSPRFARSSPAGEQWLPNSSTSSRGWWRASARRRGNSSVSSIAPRAWPNAHAPTLALSDMSPGVNARRLKASDVSGTGSGRSPRGYWTFGASPSAAGRVRHPCRRAAGNRNGRSRYSCSMAPDHNRAPRPGP